MYPLPAAARTDEISGQARGGGVEEQYAVQSGTIRTIGSSDESDYRSISSAYADITDASSSNRYTLSLTSSITDSTMVEPKSHIDLYGNGHTITCTEPAAAGFYLKSVQDAHFSNFTLDYAPSSAPSAATPALYVRQDSFDTCQFVNCTFIGNDQSDSAHGVITRHHSSPRFANCTAVGGDGGTSCRGFNIIHDSAPIFQSCRGVGGDGGNNCDGWAVYHSAAPTISDCVGECGVGGNGHALKIENASSPTVTGFTGRYRRFQQFVNIVGSGSDVVDSGFPLEQDTSPMAAEGFDSFLESIHLKMNSPGKRGSTVDIGTTKGGAEVASGIPVDQSEGTREFFDFTPVELEKGDRLFFTATDPAADFNPRYTIGYNQYKTDALYLDTLGPAHISNSSFLGSRRGNGAFIGDNATSAKKYAIGNCTFRTMDESSGFALRIDSGDSKEDPIRQCAFFGNANGVVVPTAQRGAGSVPDQETNRTTGGTSPSGTTATDSGTTDNSAGEGTGFTALGALAGIGFGTWRYLRRD